MNYIIKMIRAIEGNVDITNEAWYEIVNYYSITQLILRSHAGRTIFAIPINQCEETADTYEFSQSCTGYNAAMYSLKKSDLVSVSAEYCEAANSLIMKCELNSGVELCLFVVNESFMGKQLSDFREMDIYNLHDFMEEVINNENEFCCVSVRVTDIYGLDITNKYADTYNLAYCVNVYLHPGITQFFLQRGISINEDLYGLSEMIQWIWRSRIRKGESINIYIPSMRMRNLLIDWMNMNLQYQHKKVS